MKPIFLSMTLVAVVSAVSANTSLAKPASSGEKNPPYSYFEAQKRALQKAFLKAG